MKSQLKNLIMSNEGEKYIHEKNQKKKSPYPVEAMPFLECYINLAKKARYDQVFVIGGQEENRKKFMREFCVKLCAALLPDKNQKQSCEGTELPDEKAFARHVIFGDKAFSREVMDDLWEQEFDYRVKTLRARAKQLPYAQQAEMLKIYLIAMDEWILGLPASRKQRKTKDSEAELQDMFAGLLTHRKKACIDEGGSARYRVKNIEFNEKKLGIANNMEEAFAVLNSCGDKCTSDMLEEIRKPYLCELGNMKAPDFEQKYLDLYDYLTMFPKSDDEVKTYFVAAMRQWGQEKVDYCVATNDPSPKQSFDAIPPPATEQKQRFLEWVHLKLCFHDPSQSIDPPPQIRIAAGYVHRAAAV